MSFTPGPWVHHMSASVRVCDGQHSTKDGCRAIAEAEIIGFERSEAVDNARLIAAAPDLLAACQSVVDWFNDLKTMQHQQLIEGQTLESASKNWETMWDTPLEHPLDLQVLMDAVAKAEAR